MTAVSITAVLLIFAIGAIGYIGGYPFLSGILYLITGAAILCYSARIFFVPGASAKPFLPIMAIISIYAVYSTLMVFIFPLLPWAADEFFLYILFCPTLLIMMISIPALLFAGERMGGAEEIQTVRSFSAFTFSKKNIILVLLFFLLGVLICFLAGYVNSFFSGVLGISMVESALVAAPIAEECLKAVPILLFFLLLKPDFKSLLPAAIAVGVGFAVLETITYAMAGLLLPADLLLRLFSTCIVHAMTVSVFVASLWYVTQKGLTPSWFITVM